MIQIIYLILGLAITPMVLMTLIRKWRNSYKLTFAIGFLFILKSFFDIINADWLISGLHLLCSGIWFLLSYKNFQQKKYEEELNRLYDRRRELIESNIRLMNLQTRMVDIMNILNTKNDRVKPNKEIKKFDFKNKE